MMYPVAKCLCSTCSIVAEKLSWLSVAIFKNIIATQMVMQCHVTRYCNVIGPHYAVWQETTCIHTSPDPSLSCRSECGLRDQHATQVPTRTYLLLHLQKYLTFCGVCTFHKGIIQAHYLQYQTYCILVEHNFYIYHNYHTTAYIQLIQLYANLASWEWGYANCNSTYLVRYLLSQACTQQLLRHVPGSFKTAVQSWMHIDSSPSLGSRV